MPGTKSDGSITIDTRIDNTGFTKGSNELRRAVGSLTDRVNETGKKLHDAFKFDFGRPKQGVQTFSQAIRDANAEIKDLGELGKKALDGDAAAAEEFQSKSQKILNRLIEMESELEKFGNTEFKTPEFAKAEKEYGKAATQVEELTKSLEKAEAAYEKLVNDFGSSEEYESLEKQIQTLKAYQKEFDAAMKRGDNQTAAKIYLESGANKKSIQESIKSAEAEMNKMWDKFENSTSLKSAQREVDKLKEKLGRATEQAAEYKAEMDSTPAGFKGVNTAAYEKDQAALQKTIEKFREYQSAVREGTGGAGTSFSEWESFQERWKNMATLTGMIRNSFQSVFGTISNGARTAGSAVATSLRHPLQALNRMLGGIVSGARRAVSSLAKLAGSTIVKGIQRVADGARQAARRLAEMTKSVILNGLKNLGKAMLLLGKNTRKTNGTLSVGFKSLLTYALGVQSLMAIFNKMRTATLEGFATLAEQDAQFGQTVNNFKTSLELLKNSFAAAFSPIAEVALPLLTSLINSLSMAISKVGQLIAALTGKSTYKRAVASQSNIAENADNATESMDNEAEAAKEAQKTLAGFDDVEILSDNSDKNSKQDTDQVSDAAKNFEDVPIEDKFKSLADALKEMWKLADFTELGRRLGTGLKNALDKIPWAYIKSVASRLGKSLATLMNGFLEVPGLFTAIGNAIAQGINTIFEFLDAFVTNFHWASLGKAIKDLILGVLNNIDWPLIYHTMGTFGAGIGTALENALNNPQIWTAIFTTYSNAVRALFTGLNGFIKAVNWPSLGENIAIGLNEGVKAFPWMLISDTITNAINAVFDLAYNFITTFDFYQFGSYIGTSLTNAVKGINWGEIGATFAEGLNGLMYTILGFVQSTDWKAVGKAIIDAICGFFGNIDWTAWGETVSSLIKGLFDLLSGAIEAIDWSALPGNIVNAITSFLTGFDWSGTAMSVGELIGAAFRAAFDVAGAVWEAMKEAGRHIMEGGLQGILDVLADIGNWIKTNIVDPFIEGFKKGFGIASPATSMMPLGGYIIEGMLMGIINGLANIGAWIKENIVDPFVNGVKSLFGIGGEESALVSVGRELIRGLQSGISSVMSGISNWIQLNITDPFVNGVKNLFGIGGEESVLVSIGRDLIGGLQSGISSIMSGIHTWIQSNITDPFVNGVKSLFGLDGEESALVSVGRNLISGLKQGLSGAMDGAGQWIDTNVTTPICGFFESLFGIASPSTVFSSYGGYLMEGLEGGINNSKDLPKTALSNTQSDMQNAFGAARQLTAWEKIGGEIVSTGLKNGILSKSSAVLSSVSKLETDMRSTVTRRIGEWKVSGTNLMDQFQNGITVKKAELVSAIGSIASGLSQKISSFKSEFHTNGRNLMDSLQNGINSFGSQNWYNLGHNVGMGIYNGLVAAGTQLYNLAWNTAVNMYNAACNALGIASPSKEFIWIGEMIGQGLGNGVSATQKEAVSAVTSLADAVTQEAEGASPIMRIDTMIGNLDDVLSSFSDKVILSFNSMISAMESIVNGSSLTIPAIASGAVTPYSTRKSMYQNEGTTDLSSLLESMALRDADRLTRDDLTEILVNVIRQYLNIKFYIGDEQIARHANAGNAKLNRRYSTITG